MHTGWHDVKKIDNKVVWSTMFLLFFSSFFPYVTSLVSQNSYNEVAQVFYGVINLAVTTSNTLMYRSLAAIPENKDVMVDFMAKRKWVPYDIAIKILGLIVSITIYPPAVTYSILFIMIGFGILFGRGRLA